MVGLGKPKYRRALVASLAAAAVLLPAGYLAIKDSNFYQIVVLHDDKSDNKATSSNINRLKAYSRAVEDLNQHPFGRGPGTSGPASTYNSEISRFSENYFLQIGQELGYLGIASLMSVVALTFIRLWRIKSHAAYALIGGLAGFTMINLFLHGWADDASSLIFWGVLGLYINDKPKA
jgi:O-antigen ligase